VSPGRLGLLVAAGLLAPAHAAFAACTAPRASPAYSARVEAALRSRTDLWGKAALQAPGGPTFANVSGHLAPLLYARTSGGRPLTASGVYYLPFAEPVGPAGTSSLALHVADGSEILSDTTSGPGLMIDVGGSRFGSCLRKLVPARLADGWLPILEVGYGGYAEESFAAREGATLASFVRISGPGAIALRPTVPGLHRRGDRLVRGSRTYVVFDGQAARWDGRTLTFSHGTVYAAWLTPATGRPPDVDAASYAAAKLAVTSYWQGRLAAGALLSVPERRVMDAERALLVQSLVLSWRYSVGNPYEEFSFPESLDAAQVDAELGFYPVAASVLRVSFTRAARPYPSWVMGEKLVAAADYLRLSGDRGFLAQETPTLAGLVAGLSRRQEPSGLLAPEAFSSDIPNSVQGLHAQTVAWEGLLAIAAVWAGGGHPGYALQARRIAGRLGTALRRAVAASKRRLPDGSLFLPMRLDAEEQPYEAVTESREGSYWNLVAPYALASGFFPPGSAQAEGALAYLQQHGSLLLGLVRAGGYSLYGPGADPTRSGTDEVYGVNLARFLAAEDDPDELALALYGQLAAAMTPNTFVAGEAASVAPLDGLRYRAMYLPPNGVAGDSFLETLKLMLVQDTSAGIRLAFATPAAWLQAGKQVAVSGVPTRFGPVSFSLDSSAHQVRVHLELPRRLPGKAVLLRLRLPGGKRIRSVSPRYSFNPRTSTINLTGAGAATDLVVEIS
jgi:hypothetical protein